MKINYWREIVENKSFSSKWKELIITMMPLIMSIFVGIVFGVTSYHARIYIDGGPGDFRYSYRYARDILDGRDPYDYPVHNLAVPYPLPAAIFGFPLVWMPPPAAAATFFGFSSGLLVYGILLHGPLWRMLLLLSPLYAHSLYYAQWPPIILAMTFFPSLFFLSIIKPHMALPLIFSGFVKWTKYGIMITAAIGIASLIIMPTWPMRWLSQLGPYEGMPPVTVLYGGGPLILLALIRWREKGARLFVLMGLMPQRMFYDQLTLWLIPKSIKEMVILTFVSWIAIFIWMMGLAPWYISQTAGIYIPLLFIILLRKETLNSTFPIGMSSKYIRPFLRKIG
jgi:hypothetical protein